MWRTSRNSAKCSKTHNLICWKVYFHVLEVIHRQVKEVTHWKLSERKKQQDINSLRNTNHYLYSFLLNAAVS